MRDKIFYFNVYKQQQKTLKNLNDRKLRPYTSKTMELGKQKWRAGFVKQIL